MDNQQFLARKAELTLNAVEKLHTQISLLISSFEIELQTLRAELEDLEEENEVKATAMHNAREVYIGMDGFKPETAPEGYCLHLLKQMYEELCDKPTNLTT